MLEDLFLIESHQQKRQQVEGGLNQLLALSSGAAEGGGGRTGVKLPQLYFSPLFFLGFLFIARKKIITHSCVSQLQGT